MFCKHKWKLLSKEITKSKFDELKKSCISVNFNAIQYKFYGMLDKYLIQVFSCDKCGKIKKFIDKI